MSAKKGKGFPNKPKTRKEIRKEQRKNKKIRRNEYYTNRRKPGQFVRITPQLAAELYKEEIEEVPALKSAEKSVKSNTKAHKVSG